MKTSRLAARLLAANDKAVESLDKQLESVQKQAETVDPDDKARKLDLQAQKVELEKRKLKLQPKEKEKAMNSLSNVKHRLSQVQVAKKPKSGIRSPAAFLQQIGLTDNVANLLAQKAKKTNRQGDRLLEIPLDTPALWHSLYQKLTKKFGRPDDLSRKTYGPALKKKHAFYTIVKYQWGVPGVSGGYIELYADKYRGKVERLLLLGDISE